jgi:hypothetical protein
MHDSIGSRLALVAIAVTGVLVSHDARAQVSDNAQCPAVLPACTTSRLSCCTTNFTSAASSKAIIIPLDRCHQPASSNSYNPVTSDGSNPTWCKDPTGVTGDGMNYAYGLAYRLMQQNIPVYWIVNPTKAPSSVTGIQDIETEKDVDFWVVSNAAAAANGNPPASGAALSALTGTAPVTKLTTDASFNLVTDTSWGSSGKYTKDQFPLRGSAFMIAPSDRAAFDAFWKNRPNTGLYNASHTGCGTATGTNCYDFTAVALYEVDPTAHFVWQDYTKAKGSYPNANSYYKFDNQLPVGMRVDYAPPKIALVGGNLLTSWLKLANLNDPDSAASDAACINGTFSRTDSIGCIMSTTSAGNGKLANGFTWAWVDDASNCAATIPRLKTFATAVYASTTAGNVMFANSGISAAETCAGNAGAFLGKPGTGLATGGTSINEGIGKPPFIVRYPSNMFSQYGDLPLNFSSGTVASMTRAAANSDLYNSIYGTPTTTTLHRLVTAEGYADPSLNTNPTCKLHDDLAVTASTSPASCDDTGVNTAGVTSDITDLYVYGRYANNPNNGIVFYSPGNNLSPNGQQAQLKLVLSALVATPPLVVEQAPVTVEVSRASPIATLINGQSAIVQGSYEYTYTSAYDGNGVLQQHPQPRTQPAVYTSADLAEFTFPAQQGHMRARVASTITTSGTAYGAGTILFDAATGIPPVTVAGCGTNFTTSCRTVFTTTATTANPAKVFVANSSAGVTALGGTMLAGFSSADQATFIGRVLAGKDTSGNFSAFTAKLGGVDRSTVAVIPPSSVAGPVSRPTIAYFGATDGMLHAVCASVAGNCTALGKELWAYIPRVNLPNLRYNTARIDGSPRVIDVFGDFAGTGTKSWKTVLTLQTGSGDPTSTNATPAVYALDISDPTNPSVLWEYATPSSRGAFELGVGLTVAAGDTTISGINTNLTVLETNNGGTGAAGVVVTAIKTDSGAQQWQWSYAYPSPPRGAGAAVPATGVPGGAVGVDKTDKGGNSSMDTLVFGDLYGNLWELDPAGNGTSGKSKYTSAGVDIPLFSWSTNYHPIGAPPTIYSKTPLGTQYAAFADGGYVDTGTLWGNTTTTLHYLLAVNLNSTNATLNELATATDLPIKVSLGTDAAGKYILSYSSATVVGDQVFVTGDSTNVGSATYGTSSTATGSAIGVSVQNGATQTIIAQLTAPLLSGSSSIANSGSTLYGSSGANQQALNATATNAATTNTVTSTNLTSLKRKLWLRPE